MRTVRVAIQSNDKPVTGYQRGGMIAYPEPDGTWTVERGDPESAPASPRIIASGLTRKQAKGALR